MTYNRLCVAAALIGAMSLGGCATPAPTISVERPVSPVLEISSETFSWGVAVERWSVDASGVGRLTTTAIGPDATPQTQSLKLPAGGFGAILDAIEPLAARLQDGIPCNNKALPTDMQTEIITWSRAANTSQLSLYGGCRSDEANQAFAAIAKAREIALSGAVE